MEAFAGYSQQNHTRLFGDTESLSVKNGMKMTGDTLQPPPTPLPHSNASTCIQDFTSVSLK